MTDLTLTEFIILIILLAGFFAMGWIARGLQG